MTTGWQTIPAVLAEAAQKFAKNPWLIARTGAGWTSDSFEAIYQKALSFAAWLLQQGIGRGDRVALIAQASPEWLAAQLGVLIAGGTCVPFSTRLLPAELRLRLDHSEPRFVITSGPMREKTAALVKDMASAEALICLDEDSLPI